MPVINDPNEPGYQDPGGNPSPAADPVTGGPVQCVDIKSIVAQMKEKLPQIRDIYQMWLGYMVPGDVNSVIIRDKMDAIGPLLAKAEPLTDEEADELFGAILRVAVEFGKEQLSKIIPFLGLGSDITGILQGLGIAISL